MEHGNWKPHNVKAILSNVNLVFSLRNINKLNNPAYKFIMNVDGFIAHYNLEGFKSYYRDLRELIADLNPENLRNNAHRVETDDDFRRWYGEAYNKSEADVLRGLAVLSEKCKDEISAHFAIDVRKSTIDTINSLIMQHEIAYSELE